MTNEQQLCQTWDKIFNHLEEYDFSLVKKVFIDTINLQHDTFAVHSRGVIVIDPKAFSHRGYYKSNYTEPLIQENDLLLYLLLHEVGHMLIGTGQLPKGEDEEVSCDEFAFKVMEEMQ